MVIYTPNVTLRIVLSEISNNIRCFLGHLLKHKLMIPNIDLNVGSQAINNTRLNVGNISGIMSRTNHQSRLKQEALYSVINKDQLLFLLLFGTSFTRKGLSISSLRVLEYNV